MKLKVKVEEFTFEISVGNGLNDLVWLSLAAAKHYGQNKYPRGNYLPVNLKIGTISPHPRTKIMELFEKPEKVEELGGITVELQHSNTKLTPEQKQWFDRAFGKDRNMMHYEFTWRPGKDKTTIEKDRLKGIQHTVRISYKMFPELFHEFNPANYLTIDELPLIESEVGSEIVFSAEKNLPFGDITPQAIITYTPNKDNKDEESEMSRRIKEHFKLMEEVAQKMELKEEEKTENILSGLCPFTFETLWNVIENNQEGDKNMNLDSLDENLKEEVSKILTENLNKIFEIFFQYTFLYEQNEKKDELKISCQDLMHFLKFYQICPDSQSLFRFIEFYDVEKKRTKSLKATLNVSDGIKFPEFIVILLKSAYFLQTFNIISETENYNTILQNLVNKMLRIDSNDTEFNEFHKYMKYNMVLVGFLRENSEKLMRIFQEKLEDTIQTVKYNMLREEIKSIIVESGFKGDNNEEIEEIIKVCYRELMFENYQGFEGIFYHEFLQCMQWLSLMLVSDQSELDEAEEKKENDDEVEETAEVLIEKMKYFLGHFKETE